MNHSSECPDRVCQCGGFLCLCAQEERSAEESELPAPTHRAQTKQQDECFLSPAWHGGTPLCPCGRLNEKHSEQRIGYRRGEDKK